eukprot:8743601-Pyramimonas_sp.AAC.1
MASSAGRGCSGTALSLPRPSRASPPKPPRGPDRNCDGRGSLLPFPCASPTQCKASRPHKRVPPNVPVAPPACVRHHPAQPLLP